VRHGSLLLAIALALAASGCAGTTVGVGVRPGYYPGYYPGYHYGRGPFWGYDRGPVIVVPPGCGGGDCGTEPPPEIDPPIAVPLPEPPPVEAFPDMGMPGDFGGFDGFDGGGFDAGDFDAGGFDL